MLQYLLFFCDNLSVICVVHYREAENEKKREANAKKRQEPEYREEEQARDCGARQKRRESIQVRDGDTQYMAELRSGEYGITEAGRRNITRRQQRKDPEVRKKERQDKAFIRQGRDSMACK